MTERVHLQLTHNNNCIVLKITPCIFKLIIPTPEKHQSKMIYNITARAL